jgi:hypothetical protein
MFILATSSRLRRPLRPAAHTETQLLNNQGSGKQRVCSTGFGAGNTNLASVHAKRRERPLVEEPELVIEAPAEHIASSVSATGIQGD